MKRIGRILSREEDNVRAVEAGNILRNICVVSFGDVPRILSVYNIKYHSAVWRGRARDRAVLKPTAVVVRVYFR